MERIVDFIMTRLFQMAEYVCGKCSFLMDDPATITPPARQDLTPTIHFDREEQMVEGDLFK